MESLSPPRHSSLSYALLTALTARLRTYTAELTKNVWKLEQRVTGGHLGDPESLLEEMFRTRHGLLTVSTMSALSREVYARMVTLTAFGPGTGESLLQDAANQFHHLSAMAESQKAYLQGTIEFYQARTNTKMTVAAERLAVIAAVALPITALSSVFGMNVIVNEKTQWAPLVVTLESAHGGEANWDDVARHLRADAEQPVGLQPKGRRFHSGGMDFGPRQAQASYITEVTNAYTEAARDPLK